LQPPGTHHTYSCLVHTLADDTAGQAMPGCVQEGFLALPKDAALVVRTRQPGDRFRPAGRGHSIRLQDYLTEREVPALVRDLLPLLVVDGTIAWVIGHEFGADFVAARADATHGAIVWRQDA